MNTSPLVSVIVPVYNTEKYLHTCLQSLARQTWQHIEVLVVNNDTPDRSQDIIDEFSAKDPRFISMNHPQGNVGGARNAAIKQARGEFVSFVDSDDWVAPTYIETLLKALTQHDADLADVPGMDVDEQGRPIMPASSQPREPMQVYSETARFRLRLSYKRGKPWGKLIRLSTLREHNLWFPEDRPHEDIAFISACFMLSKKVVFCQEPLYYYRHVPTSLSHSDLQLLPVHLFANFIPVRRLLKQKGLYESVATDFEYQLVHMIIGEENAGSGRLKYMSSADMKAFAAQENGFFESLPADIFAGKKRIFRFKWQVFRWALRHHCYGLPRALRPVYKLLAWM